MGQHLHKSLDPGSMGWLSLGPAVPKGWFRVLASESSSDRSRTVSALGPRGGWALPILLCLVLTGCGALGGHGGGGGGKNLNPPVTGLAATAGNAQITLNWDPFPGAVSYNVARGTTSGSVCPSGCNYITNANPPTTTSYTDLGLVNGRTYYYQVNANYGSELSSLSNQASASPSGPTMNIAATVDVFSNAHGFFGLYGGAFPKDAATIQDGMALNFVRWGGNSSSTYNWQLGTYNAASDYFFEDFNFCGIGGGTSNGSCADGDSAQFVKDVGAAGGFPLITMPMLPRVAAGPESSSNGHWSFPVSKDGAQCHADPHNSDAGDGITQSATCDAQPTYLVANPTDINNAYVPLLDDHSKACPSGNCVYRSDWVAALLTAYGTNPYARHEYEMDNEMDIWGSTHRDIHPNPSGYDEMASVYLSEATKLRGWDPQADLLGPVSCCWWYYWNEANSNDKAAHAGIDFLPWWLNQIYWQDQISGTRSLDRFDIHAYPDAPITDSSGNPLPKSQLQALATSIYRDYWDPTFVSPSTTINQPYATSIQPNKTIPFRIPRMRALVNSIYPGTPLAITEWNAAFAGESDFSTALGDADAYGIMGREKVGIATRWIAPNPANPNYLALKLYANNGNGGTFATVGGFSVSDTHNGDPSLFSTYAGMQGGGGLGIMVINKDPQRSAQVQFTISNFNPTTLLSSLILASTNPTAITVTGGSPWSAVQSFPPYSITLLIIGGKYQASPTAQWDLSPDAVMV